MTKSWWRIADSFLSTASEDLQGGGVFSVVVGLYDDLHVLIEGDEEAQKALHGELTEVAAQQITSGAEARFIFLRFARR